MKDIKVEVLSPNERLTIEIATALVDAGLVPAERIEAVQQKVGAGTARVEDWLNWVDLTSDEKVNEASSG